MVEAHRRFDLSNEELVRVWDDVIRNKLAKIEPLTPE